MPVLNVITRVFDRVKLQLSNSRHLFIALLTFILSISTGVVYYQKFKPYDVEEKTLLADNLKLILDREIQEAHEMRNQNDQYNQLLLDTNNYLINTSSKALATVSVSNNRSNYCEAGQVNGCWLPETKAIQGDTISVSITYANTGVLPITGLSVSFKTFYSHSKYTFNCLGGLKVNHKTVKTGIISVYLDSIRTLKFLPPKTRLLTRISNKAIDGRSLIYPNTLNVATILPGYEYEGIVMLKFVVLNR